MGVETTATHEYFVEEYPELKDSSKVQIQVNNEFSLGRIFLGYLDLIEAYFVFWPNTLLP